MGHRKSSAALLIVCERIFLLLGADHSSADQVRTKDDELLKRVLVNVVLKMFLLMFSVHNFQWDTPPVFMTMEV